MEQTTESLKTKIADVMKNTILREASNVLLPHRLIAGLPMLVRENEGKNCFWRVPVIETLTRQRRHIGFFDLRQDDAHRNSYTLLRYGLLPVDTEKKAEYAPRTVTELRPDEIIREARTKFGKESVCEGDPNLVYLGFETRVAWKCKILGGAGGAATVYVTPGYAFTEEELSP